MKWASDQGKQLKVIIVNNKVDLSSETEILQNL